MTRPAAFIAACAMVVVIALMASWGVNEVLVLVGHHPMPEWMAVSSGSVSGAIVAVILAISSDKPKKADDERLTPIVRRDPVTGLRQL